MSTNQIHKDLVNMRCDKCQRQSMHLYIKTDKTWKCQECGRVQRNIRSIKYIAYIGKRRQLYCELECNTGIYVHTLVSIDENRKYHGYKCHNCNRIWYTMHAY